MCGMSHEELSTYNSGRKGHAHNVPYLPKYCFMSSYVTTLLRDGYGFPAQERIHFVDEVGGYKVRSPPFFMVFSRQRNCVIVFASTALTGRPMNACEGHDLSVGACVFADG